MQNSGKIVESTSLAPIYIKKKLVLAKKIMPKVISFSQLHLMRSKNYDTMDKPICLKPFH